MTQLSAHASQVTGFRDRPTVSIADANYSVIILVPLRLGFMTAGDLDVCRDANPGESAFMNTRGAHITCQLQTGELCQHLEPNLYKKAGVDS